MAEARREGVTFDPRQGSYGRRYARNMPSGVGQGGWEQIEMEDMMIKGYDSDDNHP